MDLATARSLVPELWPAQSIGSPDRELEWTIATTTAEQFATEPLAVFAEPDSAFGWLLFDSSLFRGESVPNVESGGGSFRIKGWPLESKRWAVALDSYSATFPFGRGVGLETTWEFRFDGEKLLSIDGQIYVIRDEPSELDDPEVFARALASRVGWSALQ
jgi:hypothetical protein